MCCGLRSTASSGWTVQSETPRLAGLRYSFTGRLAIAVLLATQSRTGLPHSRPTISPTNSCHAALHEVAWMPIRCFWTLTNPVVADTSGDGGLQRQIDESYRPFGRDSDWHE